MRRGSRQAFAARRLRVGRGVADVEVLGDHTVSSLGLGVDRDARRPAAGGRPRFRSRVVLRRRTRPSPCPHALRSARRSIDVPRLSSTTSTTGLGWELTAITAVVVGGTRLKGGIGRIGHNRRRAHPRSHRQHHAVVEFRQRIPHRRSPGRNHHHRDAGPAGLSQPVRETGPSGDAAQARVGVKHKWNA